MSTFQMVSGLFSQAARIANASFFDFEPGVGIASDSDYIGDPVATNAGAHVWQEGAVEAGAVAATVAPALCKPPTHRRSPSNRQDG
jgi:hypothetical protein